jgi:E3 ubiquitin-protein ligase BRE1
MPSSRRQEIAAVVAPAVHRIHHRLQRQNHHQRMTKTEVTRHSSTPCEKESTSTSNSISERESSNTGSSSRADKLHRDYRRARKDLAAMTASKEAAKAKLERAEKERESLVESNARLLKQISEKDEMNAKSLSTILHLKSLTEQLTAEKSNLEQQSKTASQLALAARLATNAKERVSDEMMKEKKALQDQIEQLENQLSFKRVELDRISHEFAEARGKMATENSELTNALKRIDELTIENEEQSE